MLLKLPIMLLSIKPIMLKIMLSKCSVVSVKFNSGIYVIFVLSVSYIYIMHPILSITSHIIAFNHVIDKQSLYIHSKFSLVRLKC